MIRQNLKSYIINVRRGAASLPSVMGLGVLILIVGISITAISLSESFVSYGSAHSSTALYYAELGAKDALLRVARNKNYSGSYSIDMVSDGCVSNDGCATVTVGAGAGTPLDLKVIDSVGRVKAYTRTLRALVEYDSAGYGEIATTTWREVTN